MSSLWKFLKAFWHYAEEAKKIAGTALFIMFCLFVVVCFFALISLLGKEKKEAVLPDSALLIDIKGGVVEKVPSAETLGDFINDISDKGDKYSINDILNAIRTAKTDENIKGIVLKLDDFNSTGLTKTRMLVQGIEDFKTSGKTVIAISDGYTQEQYFLACSANKIYMNSMGFVLLNGFGHKRLFFKDAIEKLKIQVHIFRVGTYKAALEPFFRNDMSEEAKLADLAWLNELWKFYKDDIKKRRSSIKIDDIDNYINTSDQELAKFSGDPAAMALASGLVDGALSRDELNETLIKTFGVEEGKKKNYKNIKLSAYIKSKKIPQFEWSEPENQIGVVYAQGNILDGEQPESNIGGDTVSAIIKKARLNVNIKALVLRIDSGGGSVFASELIRKEVELFKLSGRPVIASFSSVAASGGYWIATPADEIWASSTTITGSIGIFGAFPTFERMANNFGIYSDGVGTTKLANGMDLFSPINPIVQKSLQSAIEHGYDEFITIVAKSRKMTKENVDKIAQGRVWTGAMAKQIGLVDQLGDLNDAIVAAAKRANLTDYKIVTVEKDLSEQAEFFKKISDELSAKAFDAKLNSKPSVEANIYKYIKKNFSFYEKMNDPQNIYAYSLIEEAP